MPRFRAAIDAKVHAAGTRKADAVPRRSRSRRWSTMLGGLPADARRRFERLHARCVEMRAIAAGVRGAAGDDQAAAEEIRTPGLDRLLWLFLRLLLSKTALDRFLATMNNQEITARLEQLRKDLAAAQTAGDERIVTLAAGQRRHGGAAPRQLRARARRTPSSCRSSSIASRERSRRSPRWRSTGRIRTS